MSVDIYGANSFSEFPPSSNASGSRSGKRIPIVPSAEPHANEITIARMSAIGLSSASGSDEPMASAKYLCHGQTYLALS